MANICIIDKISVFDTKIYYIVLYLLVFLSECIIWGIIDQLFYSDLQGFFLFYYNILIGMLDLSSWRTIGLFLQIYEDYFATVKFSLLILFPKSIFTLNHG